MRTPKALRVLAWTVVGGFVGALASAAPKPSGPAPPIRVHVDASAAPRGVFHSRLEMPVRPGPLTLTYPKWIPGEHSPTGPITQVVGLRLRAAGRELKWRRDPVDMHAFDLFVPQDVSVLEVEFDYLSPPDAFGGGYGEGPNATADLAVVLWNQQLLLPRGAPSDTLVYLPSVTLPAGWQHDSALEVARREGDLTEFAPVNLTTLVDSPLFAGLYFRSYPVVEGEAPVRLSLVADDPADLAVPPERIEQLRRVVGEAQALFGSRPYRSYVWLVALTDAVEPNGLEHPESSDNRLPPKVFVDEEIAFAELRILPHEYVHSWNGKYRRPRGLATGDYAKPMDGSLLWIYEGLTRYLGDVVLATRAGIRSPEATRDYLAWMTSQLAHARPGREWRPLGDTATAVQLGMVAPGAGSAVRRGLDYYEEGALVWLEVDAKLRELSGGARSLDDFCRAFFGGARGAPSLRPYDLEDVVAALAALAPFDWKSLFRIRVEEVRAAAPIEGLTAAGWGLGYGSAPNGFMAGRVRTRHTLDWAAATGLRLSEEGELQEVVYGSPAFEAGLAPGAKIIAIGDAPWSPAEIERQIGEAFAANRPLTLFVERQKRLAPFEVAPKRGAVYPHLVAVEGAPDRLAEILKPLAPAK